MKLKELFTKEMYSKYGDIDVYDDYDERCAVAWCGNLLTEEGLEYYKDTLELECDVYEDRDYKDVTVHCRTGKQAHMAAKLLEDMAGYCGEEHYDRMFYDPDDEPVNEKTVFSVTYSEEDIKAVLEDKGIHPDAYNITKAMDAIDFRFLQECIISHINETIAMKVEEEFRTEDK